MKDPLKAKRNSGLLQNIPTMIKQISAVIRASSQSLIYDELLGSEQEPNERSGRLKSRKSKTWPDEAL